MKSSHSLEKTHSHPSRQRFAFLVFLEPLVVIAAAPVLLFPSVRPQWTALALASLVLIWLIRWIARREPWPVTPFNGALLLFMLMIPVGIWASATPELTLPKATGLVLGLASFRALALSVRNRRVLVWAIVTFCALGIILLTVGVLSANWLDKVAPLTAIARRIPRLIGALPDLRAAGVSPNQIAGALNLYFPLAIALAGVSLTQRKRSFGAWVTFLGSGVLLMLVSSVLLLTQSRSGWLGGAAGLLTLIVSWGLRDERPQRRVLGWGSLLAALGLVAAVITWIGPQSLTESLFSAKADPTALEAFTGEMTLIARVEIGSRALYAIQDFAFTGCGLGSFRKVVHMLYPLFILGPNYDIAHAHNIFLQTALDLGIPGLIGYLALLGVAFASCWQRARAGGPFTKGLCLGLLSGLVGLHVYGLTDALALGSKPALAFWMALGLIAVLVRETPDAIEEAHSQVEPGGVTWRKYLVPVALIILAIVAGAVYLHHSGALWNDAAVRQPAIRLPVYTATVGSEVRLQSPPSDGGWQGQLEIATFTTTHIITDVVGFYHNVLSEGDWITALEAGDAESWGGIYTRDAGLSVCLLNLFPVENEVWGSIVCGDKVTPVVLPGN